MEPPSGSAPVQMAYWLDKYTGFKYSQTDLGRVPDSGLGYPQIGENHVENI